jgi:hypothetical protein
MTEQMQIDSNNYMVFEFVVELFNKSSLKHIVTGLA